MKHENMQIIVAAAFRWRFAEVHAAACRLGIRTADIRTAEIDAEDQLRDFRLILDRFNRDEHLKGVDKGN